MSDYLPKFKPGQAVTYKASADVKSGRLVEITGNRTVAHAAADSTKVVGVAGFDVKAGEDLTVYSGGVQRITAASAIAAGESVVTAADGKGATGTTNRIGIALEAASADGDVIDVHTV